MSAEHDTHADTPKPVEHGLGFELPEPARPTKLVLLAVGAAVCGLFALAFFYAYLPRAAARRELEASASARQHALQRVAVVLPKLVADGHTLRLSGSIQPLEETALYARADGYVDRWLVDIGTRVKEGELLAVIETPELTQQLLQGRATLAQSRASLLQSNANRELASSRLERTNKLVEAGVASQQELDQNRAQSTVGNADVEVAQAAVAAQQANIQRLTDLKAFSRITAPFAGTITARAVERGSLVAAGNSTPLFRLAATDIVRVFVQVPQSAASGVRVDMPARVRIREFPEQPFDAKVARTAGALDSGSRTLNTEIRVPNQQQKLLAGMYAEVELTLATPQRVFELPATALMSDAKGLRVAIVTPENKVRFQSITLERDLGASVQVATGIEPSDRVVQIASPDLSDGQAVEISRQAP